MSGWKNLLNLSGHQQFQPERVVHQFDQVAFQISILAGPPADRADFDVGVVRIGVLDFVMHARSESIVSPFSACRPETDLIEPVFR